MYPLLALNELELEDKTLLKRSEGTLTKNNHGKAMLQPDVCEDEQRYPLGRFAEWAGGFQWMAVVMLRR